MSLPNQASYLNNFRFSPLTKCDSFSDMLQ